MDYQTIKEMARANGITIGDLCALAPNNDPFYTGRPSEVAAAEWFTDLWHRFGYTGGVHLRRVHYQVVSQEPVVTRPDGKPYENTESCWSYLCNAGKWARYLGLVDYAAFVDRRNPDAIINAPVIEDRYAHVPGYWVHDSYSFAHVDLPEFPELPRLMASGYDNGNLQPYHVEVWCEKTTMNDVLEPLCKSCGADLITGAGELSITAVVDFMERVECARRPARILYVSDYDPAGLGMPISVARKVEFLQRQNGRGARDIRLQPIILTASQVADYDLPRVPVKESDKRKANWQRDHGKGQVELDALEALHPGELRRIVEEAILQYHDPDLELEARRQRCALQVALDEEQEAALSDLQGEIDELEASFDSIVERFEQDTAGVKSGLSELHAAILARLETVEVDVDDYPLPEPELSQEPDSLLYDSRRDYLTQLESYKAYQHGETRGKDG